MKIGLLLSEIIVDSFNLKRSVHFCRMPAEALSNSEPDFRAIFESAPAAILVLRPNPDFTIIAASNAYLRAAATERSAIVGRRLFDVYPSRAEIHGPDPLRASLDRLTRTGERQSAAMAKYNIRNASAELEVRFWSSSTSAVFNDRNEIAYLLHNVQDTNDENVPGAADTQLVAMQRNVITLLEQKARVFDTVLSGIRDFAYAFDSRGTFIYVNQALLDLWGLRLEQAVGKDFFDLKYPDALAAKLQRQIQQVFDTGQGLTDETPYTSPAGEQGFYEYVFSPVFLEGRVDVVAGATRDVTGRKHTEQQLREARDAAEAASRAKDHFLAVLSHELRTPLSPVVMTVAAMEIHPELPYDLREDVAMIRRNIDLETKLIDDLLDLSRVTTGKLRLQLEPAHLHQILRHTYEVCASDVNAKRLSVRFDLKARQDQVIGDPARLQQVFWNLMKNAIKFSTEGGVIHVSSLDIQSGRVRVAMTDNGVGITPEVLPRIFDAFEQGDTRTNRQFGGLGLGLAISKALIDMHGGTISATSEGNGTGATFTVEMSVAPPTQAPLPAALGQPVPASGNNQPRVLLVEDHPDTARTLAKLLNLAGYDTQVAHSVAGALKMASERPFDIVVSDIGLPDASGYDLMKKLRETYGMKGIALSGYGMEEDMRRGREAGFNDHVVKPINVAQLDAVIRRVINQARSQ